jgi:hypothetical protein
MSQEQSVVIVDEFELDERSENVAVIQETDLIERQIEKWI